MKQSARLAQMRKLARLQALVERERRSDLAAACQRSDACESALHGALAEEGLAADAFTRLLAQPTLCPDRLMFARMACAAVAGRVTDRREELERAQGDETQARKDWQISDATGDWLETGARRMERQLARKREEKLRDELICSGSLHHSGTMR